MTYVSEWMTLPEALNCLLEDGQNEAKAKADLCNAIADRRIDLRACLADGSVLGSGGIEVPGRLNPENFDWPQSQPQPPWQRPVAVVDRYFDSDRTISISLIELRRADVMAVLTGAPGKPQPAARQRTGRPTRGPNIRDVLELHHRNNSYKALIQAVLQQLGNNRPGLSESTIRRHIKNWKNS